MTSTPVMGSINTQAMSLMNSVTNNISKTGGTDFKDFMNLAGNQSQTQTADMNKPVKVAETDNGSKEIAKPETAETKNVENKQDSTAPADETKEVSKEDVTAVDKAIGKVKEVIEEELKITDEELMAALSNLGLNLAALLDTDKLPAIITEVTGAENVLAIATDPELYDALTTITETAEFEFNELVKDLDIPVEDFKAALRNVETNTEPVPEEVKEPEIPVETEIRPEPELKSEELAEKIQITVSPKVETVTRHPMEVRSDEKEVPVETVDKKKPDTDNVMDSETETFTEVEEKQPVDSFSEKKEEPIVNPALNFAEKLIDKAVQSFTEVAEQPLSYTEIDAADILNQMTESIKVEITPETSEINLRLHPESLGSVTVKVSQNHEGIMRAQFTTQNESVRAIVESQALVLKEALESKGVKVEAVEVLVQSHGFERNLSDQNRGSEANEQQGSNRRRIRRINLTEGTTETVETEEDTLAREMMAANGNTIDYSA